MMTLMLMMMLMLIILVHFQDNVRCFILVKIHDVFPMQDATGTCSERLPIQLIDMGGHLRRATAWPPVCHWEIWKQGAVVTILGCFVSMMYSSWNLPNDCCVVLDKNTTSSQFPNEIISTSWDGNH